ncbi:MAG: UDP-N-acetylmuramoyl-tripeptide--D-alanyl-D-alanine ligase [Verrucomicrobiota bacterium]|nr:UDP-N-acetylmuramoyl-tripeptide--D-alanyl-D-alanine ligase [Verrucomicrobiota bacterium]
MNATPLSQIPAWAGGRLIGGDPARTITDVTSDSRSLKPGDLFVAIRGEKFDGHDFLADAARLGAAGAIVDHEEPGLPASFALIVVADTVRGLQSLASAHRAALRLTSVCITGSNGKTSTKDLCGSVLAQRFSVTRTAGNLNNHLGVPFSILRADSTHDVGVFEIGMNHAGEIAPLAAIARPDIAIITNVGGAHIEFLGTLEAIAQEKGMLAEAVGEKGTVILNADDAFTPSIAKRTRARVITAGLLGGDVRATDIEHLSVGTKFRLHATGQCVEAELPVPGEHMVRNALLACAAGITLGLTLDECAAGLRALNLTAGRLTQKTVGGIRILDDTYNANPDSVSAALVTLARMPSAGRRIAVLGGMGELGDASERGHRSVGEVAGREKISCVITVGESARWIAEEAENSGVREVIRTTDAEDAARILHGIAHPGDTVLVKASRSARLERIVQAMEGRSC